MSDAPDESRPTLAETIPALLARLDPDRDRAWEILSGVERRLKRFFEDKNCLPAEECVEDTVARAARKFHEGAVVTTEDAYGFILGIAYNVSREYWKSRERKTEALDDLPAHLHPASDPVREMEARETEIEEARRLACMRECLAKLPEGQRDLLASYHAGGQRARIEARETTARELGIPLNALRIRVHRLREKLRECLERCLKRGEKS